MSVRAIVVTVCLVTLLPGVAAAQSIGGGVKGGVSLADVPGILADGVSPADPDLKTRTMLVLGGIRF